MSAEKISDHDKRLSILEVSLNKVLEAVEKQTNSTDRLSECVAKQTVKFDYLVDEVKDLKAEVKEAKTVASQNKTEIAVIKRGNKWQEWAERAVIMVIMGAIFWAVKNTG